MAYGSSSSPKRQDNARRQSSNTAIASFARDAEPRAGDQSEDGRDVARKARDPKTWRKKNSTKRLAAIFKLVTEAIPADPGAAAFRQGGTLGDHRKHWFRAKSFQQYRLFYRSNSDAKVIGVAWVNNDKTLRAYGRKTEAYTTFKGMREDGNPPDTFNALLKEAAAADKRFETSLEAAPDR